MIQYHTEYNDTVKALASEYVRKYPMVEQDDMKQTLWMWFVTHPNKYAEWSKLEQKDKDKLIARSLRNAAIKYCEKEKANTTGYDQSDLYYYDISVVETFLPSIISGSYVMPAKIKDLNFKFGKGEIADGNNWLVLRADIDKAFKRLSEAKQNILRIRYSMENSEWDEVSPLLKTTPDGARMKVHRALNSLIRLLGGYKPVEDYDIVEEQIEESEDE